MINVRANIYTLNQEKLSMGFFNSDYATLTLLLLFTLKPKIHP